MLFLLVALILGDYPITFLREAGLQPPRHNDERVAGQNIRPGSDHDSSSDTSVRVGDEDEDEGAPDPPSPESPPNPARGALLDPPTLVLDNNLADIFGLLDNNNIMRSGFFIQDNVPDPVILTNIEPRQRVVIFARLPSGSDYNCVEFVYNAVHNHVVIQASVPPPGQTRAAQLLGTQLGQEVALVAAFQRNLNEYLTSLPRNLQGHIVEEVIVHLPSGLRVEPDFRDPVTNLPTEDPIQIVLTETGADTFYPGLWAYAFLMVADQQGTPARLHTVRNRRLHVPRRFARPNPEPEEFD